MPPDTVKSPQIARVTTASTLDMEVQHPPNVHPLRSGPVQSFPRKPPINYCAVYSSDYTLDMFAVASWMPPGGMLRSSPGKF